MGVGGLSRAICALGLTLSLAGCSEDFIGNLSQRDMLDAQVLLERSGIDVVATKGEDNRYSLSGDAADRVKALEILTSQGLPRSEFPSVAEVFPGSGFLVTPFEQKIRMRYAIEQQLSETLMALEGVSDARVHVVLPEDNGRGLIKEKARASVLLTYRDGADVAAIETRSRALVVNGVQGLSYEDISVVASPRQIGMDPIRSTPATPAQPSEVVDGEGWFTWASGFSKQGLLITFALLLAIGAGFLLLMPRREENP
ncbi:type III secretion inner membrane ring lipoprotein SctJ [Agrobacterium larrymoorei]|uniref:type III secretion system inner membrane ring lipoprotein SctJ n=1 Tax=Agrobacterium larrymoorei TaxID=160699 RepID=UPI001574077F|nr:type III secretion inner membrane ring lipoprotein SctJ [Agrobacterium larrymoorei]NTJ41860.1 type III secretion inner membrane ring lipoprotein SctJ [Agrobacterium larrymoorei]